MSSPFESPNPTPAPARSGTPARPRRTWWIVAIALLAAAVLLVVTQGATWCQARAVAAMQVSRLETAETWLSRAALLGRKNPRTTLLQARLDRKRGRFPEMFTRLRAAAAEGCPRSLVAAEQLLAELQSGGLRPVDPRVAALFIKGEVDADEASEAYVLGCLRNYEFEPALTLLSSWEGDYPKDPRPNFLRGRILEYQRSEEKARRDYAAASEKAGGVFAPAEYALARLALEDQDDQGALEFFRRCRKGLDVPAAATLGEAAALRRLGRPAEAEALLSGREFQDRADLPQQLVELGDPVERAAAAYEAEQGRVAAALEKFAEAERWLAEALETNPRDWKLRNVYATVLSREGKAQQAAAEFEKVAVAEKAVASCDELLERLKKNPADVEARYELGRIFREHISEGQGEAWLRSVLQYDPSHAAAKRELELLRRDNG